MRKPSRKIQPDSSSESSDSTTAQLCKENAAKLKSLLQQLSLLEENTTITNNKYHLKHSALLDEIKKIYPEYNNGISELGSYVVTTDSSEDSWEDHTQSILEGKDEAQSDNPELQRFKKELFKFINKNKSSSSKGTLSLESTVKYLVDYSLLWAKELDKRMYDRIKERKYHDFDAFLLPAPPTNKETSQLIKNTLFIYRNTHKSGWSYLAVLPGRDKSIFQGAFKPRMLTNILGDKVHLNLVYEKYQIVREDFARILREGNMQHLIADDWVPGDDCFGQLLHQKCINYYQAITWAFAIFTTNSPTSSQLEFQEKAAEALTDFKQLSNADLPLTLPQCKQHISDLFIKLSKLIQNYVKKNRNSILARLFNTFEPSKDFLYTLVSEAVTVQTKLEATIYEKKNALIKQREGLYRELKKQNQALRKENKSLKKNNSSLESRMNDMEAKMEELQKMMLALPGSPKPQTATLNQNSNPPSSSLGCHPNTLFDSSEAKKEANEEDPLKGLTND